MEVEKRQVRIHEFEVNKIDLPLVEFRIRCSKGTYIRSLASDFGKELQSGAHLSALRRTKSGDLDLKEAMSLEDFLEKL